MVDTSYVSVKLLDWGEDGHRSEQEITTVRASFSQEVSVWHKLDHPNVTKVLFGFTSYCVSHLLSCFDMHHLIHLAILEK